MRCVCAAARYLSTADVRTLRDAWLEPRLRAQGFLWTDSTEGDDARAELSLVEYLKIPRDERVGAAAMSAFLITDLDLVGYVDGDEFEEKSCTASWTWKARSSARFPRKSARWGKPSPPPSSPRR